MWTPISKTLSTFDDELAIPSEAKELVVQVYAYQVNQAYLWYIPKKTMLPASGDRYFPQGYIVETGNVSCIINANQQRIKVQRIYYSNGTINPTKTSISIQYR